jgi:hypothetical protein
MLVCASGLGIGCDVVPNKNDAGVAAVFAGVVFHPVGTASNLKPPPGIDAGLAAFAAVQEIPG